MTGKWTSSAFFSSVLSARLKDSFSAAVTSSSMGKQAVTMQNFWAMHSGARSLRKRACD